MATTVTAYARSNAVSEGTGFDNPTNAYADDGSYASKTFTGIATHGNLFYNFGFNIPSNALVLDVIAEFKHKTDNTHSFIYYRVNITSGTWATIEEGTTDTISKFATDTMLTPSQVNDNSSSGLWVDIRAYNGATSSFTFQVDYVKVSVTYMVPDGIFDYKFPTLIDGTLWGSANSILAYDGAAAGVAAITEEMYGYGFGFDIPKGSVINGVYFYARVKRIIAGDTITIQAGYNGTKRGAASVITQNAVFTCHQISEIGSWTIPELNDSLMQFYLKATNSSCDCAFVIVDYVPFDYKPFGQII